MSEVLAAGRRATLLDVAQAAGVSAKTASRALNGERYVRPDTAARVLAAAQQLGFVPNRLAQGLRGGTSLASVGLIIADLGNPFWGSLARGLERELGSADLLLITASHEEDVSLQERLLRALLGRRVDGLVLVPAPDSEDLETLLRGFPVVAVDRPLPAPQRDEVLFDDRGGAATAVAALLARGHRRIAVVGAERTLWTVRERLAGYRAALASAGADTSDDLVRLDCPHPALAASATRDLLRMDDPPTAVLAMNNLVCRGVLMALQDARTHLDVTAFDADPGADLLRHSPSTVVNDPEAAGRVAAGLLLDRIGGDPRPARRVVLPASLVVRTPDRADPPPTAGGTAGGAA
jgi:LacI family transcriptional regulator